MRGKECHCWCCSNRATWHFWNSNTNIVLCDTHCREMWEQNKFLEYQLQTIPASGRPLHHLPENTRRQIQASERIRAKIESEEHRHGRTADPFNGTRL